MFPITCIAKKRSPGQLVKLFCFTLFKLNFIYFKCYPHHNYNVNLNNWNSIHLYSSAKPFCNVFRSLFWFVNFCFLFFLHRTSIQKWKKNWFCYVHKWVGKKEISADIKCLCRNLFTGTAAQIKAVYKDHAAKIRAVYKDHKILVIRCITLSLVSQHKISIVLWL